MDCSMASPVAARTMRWRHDRAVNEGERLDLDFDVFFFDMCATQLFGDTQERVAEGASAAYRQMLHVGVRTGKIYRTSEGTVRAHPIADAAHVYLHTVWTGVFAEEAASLRGKPRYPLCR